MTTESLKGRRAIVTGSTSGIGLGIAQALAEQGASVMLNGFGEPMTIEALRDDLRGRFDVPVEYHGADMSKPEQIRDMVKAAKEKLGGVDILVNNAGIQHVAPVTEFPEEKWDAIIAINLSAAFHAVKAAAPLMQAGGWGRIINIASVHGLVASEFKVAYVAAKHGIVGLTKVVALDLAPDGITCNALYPGYVKTPLVEKQIPEQAKVHGISEAEVKDKIFLKNHAIKEFVTVEEIAQTAIFLCGPAAAKLTGVALPIDAGWSAR